MRPGAAWSPLIRVWRTGVFAPAAMTSSAAGRPSTREDFDFMERAGRGASSVVFKARRKADGKIYCVKEIDMSAVVPEEEEQALREVQLLASFEHPYVIRYFDSFLDDEILHIVMEWAEHGTLSDRLKAPGGEILSEQQVWKWTLQIVVGLNHMHARKVLHRDLKSANVFITAAGDAKIGDLGVSRALTTMQEMAHTVVGTPYYLSPELCEGRPYNVKSDVWALGCIMFEMCSGGSMPFQASNQGALILKILSGKQAALPEGRYSDDLDDLVSRCLTKAWQRRPDTTEILARQDVVKQARMLQIKLPAEENLFGEQAGRGGRGLREAAGIDQDMQFGLNRLHSAPAAPQSREGGQKPSYLGSQEEHAGSESSLGDTGSSSGTNPSGGYSPERDGFSEADGAEAGGRGAAAGRRKGRRRNISVCQSLQELDLGGEEVPWKVQGPASDGVEGDLLPAARGFHNNKNRQVRDIDHLGRHPPRPPDAGHSGNPRTNMLVSFLFCLYVMCLCSVFSILIDIEYSVFHNFEGGRMVMKLTQHEHLLFSLSCFCATYILVPTFGICGGCGFFQMPKGGRWGRHIREEAITGHRPVLGWCKSGGPASAATSAIRRGGHIRGGGSAAANDILS